MYEDTLEGQLDKIHVESCHGGCGAICINSCYCTACLTRITSGKPYPNARRTVTVWDVLGTALVTFVLVAATAGSVFGAWYVGRLVVGWILQHGW